MTESAGEVVTDGFKRWSVGPFASGAYSPAGGHWNVLGLMHSWVPSYEDPAKWTKVYELSLLGAIAFRWGDGRFQWALFSVELKFTRARCRYGRREEAAQNRASLRRMKQLRRECRAVPHAE